MGQTRDLGTTLGHPDQGGRLSERTVGFLSSPHKGPHVGRYLPMPCGRATPQAGLGATQRPGRGWPI